jgi:hypothetical protein
MKRLFSLSFFLLTVFFSYTAKSQELGLIRKSTALSFPEKIKYQLLEPLPAGTYTVGTSGYFSTLDSVFKKLSSDGVAGAVTLELIDTLYNAPLTGFRLNGPVKGAGLNSGVTIKPAADKNVIIEGKGQCIFAFLNTCYITIDGVSLEGTTTLTLHALYNSQYSYNDCLEFFNNSDHNTIQNITFISDDISNSTIVSFTPTYTGAGAPDSNLIQKNVIRKGAFGIYITSYNSIAYGKDNVIRDNRIGTESDSQISFGIQLEKLQNTIIENNVIQNITANNSFDNRNLGINAYGCQVNIIRNNVVHGIKNYKGYSSHGILLSGSSGPDEGYNNQVYNNMVYDIQSNSAVSTSDIAGIQMWCQRDPRIYYNSVYLYGVGENELGSSALLIDGTCNGVSVKNNIFVNTRDDQPYCASTIYSSWTSIGSSDNNDLYYEQSEYSCLVNLQGTNFKTLKDWQQATSGKDKNSITEMPNFTSNNLHINTGIASNIESHAIPIAGITTDIDGDLRNPTTPDIGADEFDGKLVGVEENITLPTEFSLSQNYPNPFNPSTKINYQLPVNSYVKLDIYNSLGQKIETLFDEEKKAGNNEVEFN